MTGDAVHLLTVSLLTFSVSLTISTGIGLIVQRRIQRRIQRKGEKWLDAMQRWNAAWIARDNELCKREALFAAKTHALGVIIELEEIHEDQDQDHEDQPRRLH